MMLHLYIAEDEELEDERPVKAAKVYVSIVNIVFSVINVLQCYYKKYQAE